MSPKRLDDERVMSLVELALARPWAERLDYVRAVCGHDTELLNEVWNCIEWEHRMSGFLKEPLYPQFEAEHPFQPDQVLENRFRVVREIAQGGMGIVYEAVDEKLRRRIAIKCAKSGFSKRLPPEVRNATEISHPNICKIFEIHTACTQHGNVEFLTMEYLEGETLAERLRRGPLTRVEAREIARQVCAGLSEAHRKQVIHGDLKSSNIILTTDSGGKLRAVITDFGLARRAEGAPGVFSSGPVGGTPDYMAPELLKGSKPSVASDIYALGVILGEIALTKAGTRGWHRIVYRCTEANPALRPRDVDEISRAVVPRTRRWVAATFAATLLAVVTGLVTYQAATAPAERVWLAVRPFEGGPEVAALTSRLAAETSGVLRRIKATARTSFSLVPGPAEASGLARAGAAIGATHVLRATLRSENGSISVRAWVTDARYGVNQKAWAATYTPSEVSYIPTALAGVVTGAFHLQPLSELAAVNAAALQDYKSGIYYLRRNSGIDRALPLLDRAVALDPHSPLTHAALAEAHWWKYFMTGDTAWRDRADESVKSAERRNSDLAEVHRIAGLLEADRGRYEQAQTAYMRAIELDPNDGDAYRRLAMAYEGDNEHDKALAAFQRAIELEPNDYRNHQGLGAFFNSRANYSEAVGHLRNAVQTAPDEPTAHFALATAYMGLGQYVDAERELRDALALGETAPALNTLGAVLMYRGRDQESIQYFTRALSRFPEHYLWWMNLGTAYRRLNLTVEAARANRRGLALVESEIEKNPRSGHGRACLAYLCAWLGDRGRAESEVAQALQLSPNDNDTRRMAVKAYEALGRREASLAVLSTSPPHVLADVSRYPDLANLSRDVRFQKMLGSGANH